MRRTTHEATEWSLPAREGAASNTRVVSVSRSSAYDVGRAQGWGQTSLNDSQSDGGGTYSTKQGFPSWSSNLSNTSSFSTVTALRNVRSHLQPSVARGNQFQRTLVDLAGVRHTTHSVCLRSTSMTISWSAGSRV